MLPKSKTLKASIVLLLVASAFAVIAMAPDARRFETDFGDPIGNYNFRVEIDGVNAGLFTSVDGLSVEQEVIEYRDGSDNIVRKLPGRTKYSNITLKRGYVADDAMHDWIQSSLLDPSGETIARKNGSLILVNKAGEDLVRYNFFEAWPCKWKGLSTEGDKGETLTEEVEICIEWFEEA